MGGSGRAHPFQILAEHAISFCIFKFDNTVAGGLCFFAVRIFGQSFFLDLGTNCWELSL